MAEPLSAVGTAGSVALFVLALGIMVWPLAQRLLDAHRSKARELRLAGTERK